MEIRTFKLNQKENYIRKSFTTGHQISESYLMSCIFMPGTLDLLDAIGANNNLCLLMQYIALHQEEMEGISLSYKERPAASSTPSLTS